MLSFKVVPAGIMLLLVASAGLYLGRHTIDSDLMKSIKNGMREDEVVRVLGEPTGRSKEHDGSIRLAYRKTDRWCMFDVVVGPDGVVRSVFHDH